MDFSRFKPGQLKCVQTLDAPLVVSAGAGSGKTFTLTQRIAWALMKGSAPDGGAFLDSIDQVMAITFTDKAAGEIKSRVKSTLRSEGMAEEALKVDDAWISTIHGMCSRILRTHAVELGIDPAFSVADPAASDHMLREAVEHALSSQNEFSAPCGFDALFAEYDARSKGGFSSDSVESMLVKLVQTANASPEGCGCFSKPPQCASASELVRSMVDLIEGAVDAASTQKESARRDEFLRSAADFSEHAAALLARGSVDASSALRLFDTCWPSAGFGDKDYKTVAKEYQAACATVIQEARCLLAEPLLDQLLDLAESVYNAYKAAKRERGVLDNDDLLLHAARALSDYPDIAREYENKFKIIMVDEFQDTDQLQVDMIKRMAGPGACRLCTVGDAQQSIYRFRGADVQVYKNHLAAVTACNADGLIELPDNFRSHADVLSLVDRIFEQPQAFGSEFMSLHASRDESRVKRPFKGDGRRVDILVNTYPSRKGVDSSDVVLAEARRIARRFAELRDAGHAAGDMVVLLGRMTNAGLFAQALRDEGFACVIAGGSTFTSAPEVLIMRRLAEVIANPHATSALFEVLSSDMFALSADDFIALSTFVDPATGVMRRRALDQGFASISERFEEGDPLLSPQLAHAARIVDYLAHAAGVEPVSAMMSYAVRESGWLARLEARGAEGQSVAGNVLKAIRVVEGIERAGASGPSAVAQGFAAHLDIAKEAPGALSAEGGDFVRIMTVHASKGLEFPIAAVAEMGMNAGRSSSFACTKFNGKTCVSLLPSKSLSGYKSSSPVKKAIGKDYRCNIDDYGSDMAEGIERALTPMMRRELLLAYEAEQELQEKRRLLYVALTRAQEALVVSMVSARPSGDGADQSGIGPDSGVYDDIRTALFKEGDIPSGETWVDFGGSAPALVSRIDYAESDFDAAEPSGDDASADVRASDDAAVIAIPAIREKTADASVRLAGMRNDVASYSALAKVQPSKDAPATAGSVPCDEPSDDELFWDALCDDLLHDADKATDFGTAFHRIAQLAVCGRAEGAATGLMCPSQERVDAIARSCHLGPSSRERLMCALDRWFASDLARSCAGADTLAAELPFFMDIGSVYDASHDRHACVRYLEGSIDLFATWGNASAAGGRALIVDYKTGGSADEMPEALYAKHLLQASCYAFVALQRGYASVDAAFVRVEQVDEAADGQPQVVRYAFAQADLPVLRERLSDACDRLAKERFCV